MLFEILKIRSLAISFANRSLGRGCSALWSKDLLRQLKTMQK